MAKMSAEELHAFLVHEFPQSNPEWMRVEAVGDRIVRIRSLIGDDDLRPGGNVSAQTLMSLANTAMYLAVLATLGPVPLAVPSNLNIDFLRRADKEDVVVEARILKVGRRLVFGDIALYSDGVEEMIAHATATYSIPPAGEG